MEFPRQEHWSVLPFLFSEDLPNPGIESKSPVSPELAGRFFTTEPPEKPNSEAEASILWLKGRADSLEKTMKLGKTEGKRRRGQQRVRWLDSNGHETERTLGDTGKHSSLVCD